MVKVNKGRFGSVMWIMVMCTEPFVNDAGFTVLILYDCSGEALYSCAFLIYIYIYISRSKKNLKTHRVIENIP